MQHIFFLLWGKRDLLTFLVRINHQENTKFLELLENNGKVDNIPKKLFDCFKYAY